MKAGNITNNYRGKINLNQQFNPISGRYKSFSKGHFVIWF